MIASIFETLYFLKSCPILYELSFIAFTKYNDSFEYFKVSIIRPGRSRLLVFEKKKIVLII